MLVYGRDNEIATWVARRIPTVIAFDKELVAIGITDRYGERLIAGVVFSDYYPEFETMQVSIAADSPMWARPDTIRDLMRYAFRKNRVYKLWSVIGIDNKRSLDVNLHLGFTREAVLAHQFGKNRHAVMTRLLKPKFERLYG